MHGESSVPPSDNRYAVSAATAHQADYSSRDTLPYAGFWKRVGAYVIDYIIVWFVMGIVAKGLAPSHPNQGGGYVWVILVAGCLYYVLFECSEWQATPGKRAVGIKVTDLQGERIGFGRAIGRLFARILSVMTLGVGYAMAVFTDRRQTLHDKVAGTLVVNREESPEEVEQAGAAPPVPLWQSIAAVLGVVMFGPFGIGILAAIAIPAYQNYTLRAQVADGLRVAEPYKAAIEATVADGTPLKAIDSSKLDVSLPDTAQFVDSVRVVQGAIDIEYGRKVNKRLNGGHLVLFAVVREGSVQWYCGHASPPPDVDAPGQGYAQYTSIPDSMLPLACRSGTR